MNKPKQNHKQTPAQKRIMAAMKLLKSRAAGKWRERQRALKTIFNRVFVHSQGGQVKTRGDSDRTIRGKATIKAAKKLSHVKRWYYKQRTIKTC